MSSPDDSESYRSRLEGKLRPERIRSTLAFSGLYQLTHQLIQNAVVSQVQFFFGKNMLTGDWDYGEKNYGREVRSRDRNIFKGSCSWLRDQGALTLDQFLRLDEIYLHRHDLAHEVAKYVVDVDFEPDLDLFYDALAILRDVHRFWIEVEASVGTFDEYENLDLDDVTPAAIALLGTCISALADDLSVAAEGRNERDRT